MTTGERGAVGDGSVCAVRTPSATRTGRAFVVTTSTPSVTTARMEYRPAATPIGTRPFTRPVPASLVTSGLRAISRPSRSRTSRTTESWGTNSRTLNGRPGRMRSGLRTRDPGRTCSGGRGPCRTRNRFPPVTNHGPGGRRPRGARISTSPSTRTAFSPTAVPIRITGGTAYGSGDRPP